MLSNDTDVVVLLLFYISDFLSLGLKECWIRVGTGEKARFIPIHTLGRKLGHRTCPAVMKVHTLMGCDVTTKIGTKQQPSKPVRKVICIILGKKIIHLPKHSLRQKSISFASLTKTAQPSHLMSSDIYGTKTKTSHCLNSHQHRNHFRVI